MSKEVMRIHVGTSTYVITRVIHYNEEGEPCSDHYILEEVKTISSVINGVKYTQRNRKLILGGDLFPVVNKMLEIARQEVYKWV